MATILYSDRYKITDEVLQEVIDAVYSILPERV